MIKPVQRELYAVVGNPVSHSLSPIMMAAAFEALDHPAVYLALEVDAFEEDLRALTAVGLRGLSVTLPHKVEAFRLASERDETAVAIEAVNTLRREGAGWQGRNTDWLGATLALKRVTGLVGKSALVLGAGGVARAVVYGLKREGCQVAVANRNEDRGSRLAEAFRCSFIPLDVLRAEPAAHSFDVVVQCTSVGLMKSGGAPLLPASCFRAGMVVMDTVYRPAWTDFLLSAQGAGCHVVQGSEMLIYQGAAQLEWWLGRSMPPHVVDRMRAAVEGALLHG